MKRVGVIGASGYTGAELLRLCAGHPDLEIVIATGETMAGRRVSDLYPSLAPAYPDLVYRPYDPADVEGCDLVFLGLPHGESQSIGPDLRKRVGLVLDLAADFRLVHPADYVTWYGAEHTAPDELGQWAYGLPELNPEVATADAVAVPGCYPTAAALALVPLVEAGLVEREGIIVDAASGVSGAGRGPKENTTFCAVDEDFAAYGLLTHRHTPEMAQVIGAPVLFTPHLAPMSRGILATCYARPAGTTSTAELLDALADRYASSPFVVVDERSPSTKDTLGSNSAHLTARFDERTGTVLVLCAIDNLVKGASGQAIQCANLRLGLGETTGLPLCGVNP
jgi:N-acetyl-gamma-glutamyl-phosphate reductase